MNDLRNIVNPYIIPEMRYKIDQIKCKYINMHSYIGFNMVFINIIFLIEL